MAERKVWNQQEDQILKNLVEVRKVIKWSQIAKIFSIQFGISHRNGKQCRQRYLNHLASGLKKGDWTAQEEQKLIKLHNRYGNRWAQISRHFQGRTDNCVKNQLYSKLRKAMKYINDSIEKKFRKKFKLLKVNFIYKLIQMADEKYKSIPAIKKQAFEQSYQLKNKILKLECIEQNFDEQKVISLICQINKFNKTYKKRISKKRSNRDLNSESQQHDSIHEDLSDDDQVQLKPSKVLSKKGTSQNQVQIQIKISAPFIDTIKQSKQNIDIQPPNDQKKGFKLLQKDSLSSVGSKNIGRLHSLSIEKESGFQTIIDSLQVDKKIEEISPPNSLFNRVDPFVHGEENQNQNKIKMKTKRSSSIQSVPNIMVDIGTSNEPKNNEFKASRLRSFGSIQDSFQIQKDQGNKFSSIDKQFLNKEEVQYWLSNVQ